MEYRSRSLWDALEEPVRRRRAPSPPLPPLPPLPRPLWDQANDAYQRRLYEEEDTDLPWKEIGDGLRLSCWKGIQWVFSG